MNYRTVLNQAALLMLVLAAILAGIGAWAALEWALGDATEQTATWAFAISAAAGAVLGAALWWFTRGGSGQLGRREALLLVAISWLGGAALAGLPFFLWAELTFVLGAAPGPMLQAAEPTAGADLHPFVNPINCYFEAMSGLTTTGATILPNIDRCPPSILLWRSMTHWLGGLGIVVLFVAVLPSLGVGGKRLYKVEAPGPRAEGVRPHIRETARVLWMIYLGLTVAQSLALWAAGMPLYKALSHTFATLATGGFSTEDASIAGFDSITIELIVIFFMLVAGINFGLYYHLLRGRTRTLLRDTEVRVYLGLLVVITLIIAGMLVGRTIETTAGEVIDNASLGQALRYAGFQAVSIQTTTGFCTANFDDWPFGAEALLLLAMFIGGSAGSTAGGMKIIRVWIMAKVLYAEVEKAFRPQVVRSLKVGPMTVDDELRLATVSYVLGCLLLVGVGSGALMLIERGVDHAIDFQDAATATVATLFNIGPGLGRVGATKNYWWFADGSKAVMSVLMAMGRLELFAIIVLFTPRFWRGT